MAQRPVNKRCRDERGGCRAERRSRPVDETSDGALTETEPRGDLFVASTLHRRAEHHLTLGLRQRRQAGKSLSCSQTSLHLLVGTNYRRRRVVQKRVIA